MARKTKEHREKREKGDPLVRGMMKGMRNNSLLDLELEWRRLKATKSQNGDF